MKYVFDLDGTICDVWYGESTPDLFDDDYDAATRSISRNDYENVKPLPGLVIFIEHAKNFYESKGEPFCCEVISTVSNGKEYLYKLDFLKKFVYSDGKQVFTDVHGTVSNADKNYVLKHLAKDDDIVYFDDSLSIVFSVKEMCKKESIRNILPLHVLEIICRDPETIAKAFNIYKNKAQ